ncbi:kinase-like domain-containing protein [Trametes punicea]|nr:kinase-like domain-containing protein [Trametes punicea]
MQMSVTLAIPDLTGYVVEPYKLVQRISGGLHGVVYRAIDMTASSSSYGDARGTDRAIKVVPKGGPVLGALEIGLHSLVSAHPNVITMDDAFEDEEYYFLVLDFCLGGDLRAKIWDERVYDHNDELVRTSFLQIVDAVEACHAASVYHRDLKPENILCNENCSEVYLCDFGMGRGRPIGREFGSGTLNYMSPECLGEDIGRRPYSNTHHDIWALGVILFNLITASHPWSKASTADDQFSDYLHDPDIFLDKYDISEAANDILCRIFVLNPLGRISLPELRAAVLGVKSFFRPRNPPNDRLNESEDVDSLAFSLSVPQEDEDERLFVDFERPYDYPSSDPSWSPVTAIKPSLELYGEVNPVVRSSPGESGSDELFTRLSSSRSDIGSCTSGEGYDRHDDRDDDYDDDSDSGEEEDNDSDDEEEDEGPVTPEAVELVAGGEVNVYDGGFSEELKERMLSLCKTSDASGKSTPPSPPAVALSVLRL